MCILPDIIGVATLTADSERLFSIIDTSHSSSVLPSTIRNILSTKINQYQDCYNILTDNILAQAKTATMRALLH